jgi:hypothetical protein
MAPPPITVLLEEETGFVGSCLLEAERAGWCEEFQSFWEDRRASTSRRFHPRCTSSGSNLNRENILHKHEDNLLVWGCLWNGNHGAVSFMNCKKILKQKVRSDFLTEVIMQSFWHVTMWSFVQLYRRFGETSCLRFRVEEYEGVRLLSFYFYPESEGLAV